MKIGDVRCRIDKLFPSPVIPHVHIYYTIVVKGTPKRKWTQLRGVEQEEEDEEEEEKKEKEEDAASNLGQPSSRDRD